MELTKKIEQAAMKIGQLYNALQNTDSSQHIAKQINDILIYGDKISLNELEVAWNYFAKMKGVGRK